MDWMFDSRVPCKRNYWSQTGEASTEILQTWLSNDMNMLSVLDHAVKCVVAKHVIAQDIMAAAVLKPQWEMILMH
jgi:hypothetical protein